MFKIIHYLIDPSSEAYADLERITSYMKLAVDFDAPENGFYTFHNHLKERFPAEYKSLGMESPSDLDPAPDLELGLLLDPVCSDSGAAFLFL